MNIWFVVCLPSRCEKRPVPNRATYIGWMMMMFDLFYFMTGWQKNSLSRLCISVVLGY